MLCDTWLHDDMSARVLSRTASCSELNSFWNWYSWEAFQKCWMKKRRNCYLLIYQCATILTNNVDMGPGVHGVPVPGSGGVPVGKSLVVLTGEHEIPATWGHCMRTLVARVGKALLYTELQRSAHIACSVRFLPCGYLWKYWVLEGRGEVKSVRRRAKFGSSLGGFWTASNLQRNFLFVLW